MSLISDALKRQEQLRAPGTGAAQREVSVARPPAGNREQGTGNSNQESGARGQETRNGERGTTVKRSNGQTVKRVGDETVANPFLERERAAARRPNHTVLLMPVIGLLMLLVLLFLRREFVPSQPVQTVTVKKVESSDDPGIVPTETSVDNPADAAVLSDLFPQESESRNPKAENPGGPGIVPAAAPVENPGGPGIVSAATPVDVPTAKPSAATEPNPLSTSNFLSASSASTPLRETPPQPEPINRQTVKPSNQAVEVSPQQPAWPAFTLTGIAVGRERIAVLSTGEMLLAGETSRCGVKVKKVNASTVVFAWGGETKTLRKGEHSDKPAD